MEGQRGRIGECADEGEWVLNPHSLAVFDQIIRVTEDKVVCCSTRGREGTVPGGKFVHLNTEGTTPFWIVKWYAE